VSYATAKAFWLVMLLWATAYVIGYGNILDFVFNSGWVV